MVGKRKGSEHYIDGLMNGSKVILGQTITIIESNNPQDQQLAFEIMEDLMPHTGNSIRVGITGIPGVGKSTFIEAFGNYLISEQNKKIAVLAIDPSSSISKGSILGDKTRMESLASNPMAFIRPSPTGKTLGGVASRSREVMLLCEAAGYELILIETVGVGQSESAVKGMVDFFLLLMLAGTGDDLQGIKRGILEMADLIAINKADGENLKMAREAQKQLETALHLYPLPESGQPVNVRLCSALNNEGMSGIWEEVASFIDAIKTSGYFGQVRKAQNKSWLHDYITNSLITRFFKNPETQKQLIQLEKDVEEGLLSPQQAGRILLGTT